MDLSKYKVKHESEHHYEIEDENGSSFNIAKHGLTPKMHENIKKYCMGGEIHNYADGGEVAEEAPAEEAPVQEVPQHPLVNAQSPVKGLLQNTPIDEGTASTYQSALEQEKQAAAAKANADIQLGQSVSKIQQPVIKGIDQEMQDLNERETKRMQDQDSLARGLASGQIDPGHYYSNLSTPGKISTIIGLVLGGVGAGPNGTNQAVGVLNQQIAQDIDAQKQNLQNKDSLYGRLLQSGQDERQATLTTQSMLLSHAQAQLQQAAAKNQTPQAQAAYQQTAAQLAMQQAEISRQLSIANLRNKILTGGPVSSELAPFASDPKSVVGLGDGTIRQAISPQAAGKAQEIIGAHKPLLNTLNQLDELSVNPALPASAKYQEAKSLFATAIAQMRSATGVSRLSPETIKLFEDMANNPTELKELVLHDEKTKKLISSMKSQMDEKLSPYFPNYRTRSSIGFKPSAE